MCAASSHGASSRVSLCLTLVRSQILRRWRGRITVRWRRISARLSKSPSRMVRCGVWSPQVPWSSASIWGMWMRLFRWRLRRRWLPVCSGWVVPGTAWARFRVGFFTRSIAGICWALPWLCPVCSPGLWNRLPSPRTRWMCLPSRPSPPVLWGLSGWIRGTRRCAAPLLSRTFRARSLTVL